MGSPDLTHDPEEVHLRKALASLDADNDRLRAENEKLKQEIAILENCLCDEKCADALDENAALKETLASLLTALNVQGAKVGEHIEYCDCSLCLCRGKARKLLHPS